MSQSFPVYARIYCWVLTLTIRPRWLEKGPTDRLAAQNAQLPLVLGTASRRTSAAKAQLGSHTSNATTHNPHCCSCGLVVQESRVVWKGKGLVGTCLWRMGSPCSASAAHDMMREKLGFAGTMMFTMKVNGALLFLRTQH